MKSVEKISAIERLLDRKSKVAVESSSDPEFISWKNAIERFLINAYGKTSPEMVQFRRIDFSYRSPVMYLGKDYSAEDLAEFRKGMAIVIDMLSQLKEEASYSTTINDYEAEALKSFGAKDKVFISHSSKDREILEELIEILETIGLTSDQIFCTSFDGYGIGYGENFLERIKTELDSNIVVLFLITNNFFESPICLCEMGATWIKANEHIPILVPPFSFDKMKGVIPLTQGFHINDSLKLNLFKEKLESDFEIANKLEQTTWERKRNRIIERMNKIIEAGE